MVNLGEINETINADQVLLKVGADSYGQLTDLRLVLDRPETVRKTTNSQVVKFHAAGTNYLDATLLATIPEIASLIAKMARTSGALTAETWQIVATGKNTAVSTLTFTAVLPHFELPKPEVGAVEIRIRISITGDTVTVT